MKPKEELTNQGNLVYDIRIEAKPPIRIVGQAVRTSNAQQAKEHIVPRLMFDFMATRVQQITERVNMNAFYGVLDMSEESYDSDYYTWIAGVEVHGKSQPASGLTAREFPAMLYAVVTCGGVTPVSLFTHVYREWMPASDYESAGRYAIQYHGPQFRGSLDPTSRIEVWFPIRPKDAKEKSIPQPGNGLDQRDQSIPQHAKVPQILYDGADVDVLWDGHEDAIRWYERHLGWKVEQK